jgi:hypothetical protein
MLDKHSKHFTLLSLNLEHAVIAYYIFIGRMADAESKVCKLYEKIQRIYDPQHSTPRSPPVAGSRSNASHSVLFLDVAQSKQKHVLNVSPATALRKPCLALS